jgi:hypothetical protein
VSARLNVVKGPKQTNRIVGFQRAWHLVSSEEIPRQLFSQISQFCSCKDTLSSGIIVRTPRSPKDALILAAN